jgi:hypothetical protein
LPRADISNPDRSSLHGGPVVRRQPRQTLQNAEVIKRGGLCMVINGTAVLAFGIMSVLGVAVHNNQRANAASPTMAAVETAAASRESISSELPRGYIGNAATSPLAGLTTVALPPVSPILKYPVLN